MNSFNKFFENSDEEIIIEENEEIEDSLIEVDDTIYEIDLYNNLIGDLPLYMQNNRKIQEEYIKLTKHIINLKNEAKLRDVEDIEDYPDMKSIYDQDFGVSWIFPVVLDKKKLYKKIEINADNDEMEQYVDIASNKGVLYEDFIDELKKDIQYLDEYQRDKLSFPNYKKITYELDAPYVIKKDLKKRDVGYKIYLNNYVKLLRFFNLENKFWEIHEGFGPEKFTYELYDETGKRVGSRKAQILSGEFTNIIGFFVLGNNQTNILDVLEGEPWLDRIRMIGEATKIKRNDKAIVELKDHGLINGDKVMITDSNSEPSINGEYLNIKVINQNEFMIPVRIGSEGKEGTFAKIYTTTKLRFDKKKLDNYGQDAYLYLFPEKEIEEIEWKQLVKKILPSADSIVNANLPLLENASTIDDVDKVLNRFSINFRNLGYENYFGISEILEGKYIENKKRLNNFDYDKFYGEILKMRDEMVGKNMELKVKNDILFGDKYIFDKTIIKYYGNYPNVGTDVDSIASRYNWIINTPDHGKLYYLLLELDKVKEYKEGKIDIVGREREIKKGIEEIKKELKGIKDAKNCEKRIISPVKIYESFNELVKDVGKITDFNEGDYALIESKKSHENGMIYVWNGMNWVQDTLIQSLDDLCLLGVDKIKNFDLEKLHCLFRNACKNKKVVRLENRLEKLENELEIYGNLKTGVDEEKDIKGKIYLAELNLQIYLREIESTKKEETVEVYEKDIDSIYLDIMKIPDLQQQEYYRNLLIKKDGIIIDQDIYSIRTGKKICCGHYYYQLKIASGTNPIYSEKVTEEMLAVFGSEEQNGIIYCNHCGRPLMLMEYDTAEGLSKTTGEISKQREIIKSEIQELKEEIEADDKGEKEIELLECSGMELRNELTKMGLHTDQIVKSKEICNKLNSLNIKTGIVIKKKDFVNIIVDVIQKMQKIIEYDKFRSIELIKMKKSGVDFAKMGPQIINKMIKERYNNLLRIKKITFIAARLLIQYQNMIPVQYPSGKRSGVVFEGFSGDKGFEYMSLLIDESKIMPIIKETSKGEKKEFLQIGAIKREVKKSFEDLSDLSSIKKLKMERKIYDQKIKLNNEEKSQILVKNIPEFPKLNNNFEKEVGKLKLFKQYKEYEKALYERQKYIGSEIVKAINQVITTADDKERDNPKSIELSCCYEPIGDNYYKYIEEKTDINIKEMIEESKVNSYYYVLFLNGGVLMKHYPEKKPYINITTENKGYNIEEVRKYLFLTYIDNGIFRGEKHEYNEEGICLLTGQKKSDILKKNYNEEQERALIKSIIDKTVKKLVLGGSKRDVEEIEERDRNLVDNIDIDELKKDAGDLYKDINIFVEKLLSLTKKAGNKEYIKNFKEKLETLGRYNNIFEAETKIIENRLMNKEIDLVHFENKMLRTKVYNLRRFINNYFRRYISMVQNMFNPIEHITRLEDMDESISKDLQKYMFNRENFITNYLTKKNSEIFKKLNFDISGKVINNICGDIDKWNENYTKIIKEVNFNLSNLSEALLYILVRNLLRFISKDIEKDTKKNEEIAGFIMEIFEMIFEDMKNLDYTMDTFLPGDYRTMEKVTEKEDIKSDTVRMIDDLSYKFRKVRDMGEYEEVYDELEKEDKRLSAKEGFLKEYKDKFGKDPTDNEIIDYMEEMDKEKELDEDIDNEEYMMSKIVEEGDDVLEIGDGYGEMPQGGEEGDF